ncbi:hypothetical protein ACIRPK_29220 [Kitasatospora sp. NPDC101801]
MGEVVGPGLPAWLGYQLLTGAPLFGRAPAVPAVRRRRWDQEP